MLITSCWKKNTWNSVCQTLTHRHIGTTNSNSANRFAVQKSRKKNAFFARSEAKSIDFVIRTINTFCCCCCCCWISFKCWFILRLIMNMLFNKCDNSDDSDDSHKATSSLRSCVYECVCDATTLPLPYTWFVFVLVEQMIAGRRCVRVSMRVCALARDNNGKHTSTPGE